MATSIVKKSSKDWAFGVNNGSTATGPNGVDIIEFSAEREYSIQMDHVTSQGALDDILIGGEIQKVTITGYGTATAAFADVDSTNGFTHPVAGLGSIFTTKVTTTQSNEDFTKVTYEGMGAPTL